MGTPTAMLDTGRVPSGDTASIADVWMIGIAWVPSDDHPTSRLTRSSSRVSLRGSVPRPSSLARTNC